MRTCYGGTELESEFVFVDSLRATWVLRLIDPAPQLWKGILWSMLDEV